MIDYTNKAVFAHPKGVRHELLKPRADRQKAKTRREVVQEVFARDGYKCRCCGYDKNLHPHEITYRSQQGDPLDVSNVLTLCRLCHLEGEHGQNGKGKTLKIHGTNANGTIRFSGPWIKYITKYRATAGRRWSA